MLKTFRKFRYFFPHCQTLIDNFLFASNKNTVAGNANLNFKSIEALINRPENVTVDLQLPIIQLNINEISQFVPNLKANPYISELGKKMINGQLYANGTLSKIDITESTISWGKSTEISVEGSIYNATTPDFLKVDIPNFKISTARKDILNFVDQKALGIQLPKEIFLEGKVNGTIENVTTEAKLISSQGIIALKGGVNTTQGVRFDADLDMRMSKKMKNSAHDVVNKYSEEELRRMFSVYGELTNAKAIAAKIVASRDEKINTKLTSVEDVKRLTYLIFEYFTASATHYFR